MNDLTQTSSSIVIPYIKKILSELTTDISHQQSELYIRKKRKVKLITNYTLLIVNLALLTYFLTYYFNDFIPALGLTLPIFIASFFIFANTKIERLFSISKLLIVCQLIVAMIMIVFLLLFKVPNTVKESDIQKAFESKK